MQSASPWGERRESLTQGSVGTVLPTRQYAGHMAHSPQYYLCKVDTGPLKQQWFCCFEGSRKGRKEMQAAAFVSEGGKKDAALSSPVFLVDQLSPFPASVTGFHESHPGTITLPQVCSERWSLNRVRTPSWSWTPETHYVLWMLRMLCSSMFNSVFVHEPLSLLVTVL